MNGLYVLSCVWRSLTICFPLILAAYIIMLPSVLQSPDNVPHSVGPDKDISLPHFDPSILCQLMFLIANQHHDTRSIPTNQSPQPTQCKSSILFIIILIRYSSRRLCGYIKTSSNLKCKYIFLLNKGCDDGKKIYLVSFVLS